mmetsp:Transcript_28568/g.70699  ORF Transcript_28568/g.70699 Transcript_28568/m.70699 type:complete len:88 (+) Transcript_28568:145-408(+)|eukprot:CAMPEP_0206222756 /NCGR_PEP_ID=MMETSP0047_2-20121206/6124_1 /ASSEMBLY_ACC=CAM_ASM_000192 /TAXON_ID=195065 /ORGANISM="Chroomonas mesostigmatica_cf, Strain CCMP1168" /LENGTH=87 /DNA_ID=CAMNT_0053645591 /DNA_START=62 /DNA_END=325 /DNA_ORIENTATION=+
MFALLGELDLFPEQYYSPRWLKGHMLAYCEAGSETQTKTESCLKAGFALPANDQREYVHQLSKGCYPGVVSAPGGGRCALPGWPEPW